MNESLGSRIQINSRFIRSVRLDADLGRTDVLDGFVLQPSASSVLGILARHINETQQRAFTWTGPYGGGKSSLALSLCSLVHPDQRVRNVARRVLGVERGTPLARAFDVGSGAAWVVLPVVGKRLPIEEEIARAIDRQTKSRNPKRGRRSVVTELVKLAESPNCRGVLLLVDELGKFLEYSAQQGADVYFFQELAEAAARTKGKLIVIGILHQSFDQYAARLGRDSRDEWSKIQGRFVDLALATGSDEQIELIGRAIASEGIKHNETASISNSVARSIALRRAAVAKHLDTALDECWPLHPVTAALLGPSSRRRFSQNERSIFGFLNSVEPFGFREFLEGTTCRKFSYYYPAQFWDYLRTNFEPGILASPDGHRWAVGVEAVERTEAKGEKLHVQLVKTIAIIEMFRNGSGIVAETNLLASCFPQLSAKAVEAAVRQLAHWSVVIHRKYLGAWGIYAGSDFDIEAAISKARAEATDTDLYRLTKSIELAPVLAKRVYQQTGAMHFLSRNILTPDEAEAYTDKFQPKTGSCGEFLLLLPQGNASIEATLKLAQKLSSFSGDGELLVGVPEHAAHIADMTEELFALEQVYTTSPELDSDRVAAREINARIEVLRAEIDDILRDAFLEASWYWKGKKARGLHTQGLSALASTVVAEVYPEAPILLSELINRECPSSNSVKARRDLMYRMLANKQQDKLGYAGFSADAGLYYTILQSTTLHRMEHGAWGFYQPKPTSRGVSLKALWDATNSKALRKGSKISLDDLYTYWASKPFGVKAGVSPVLALAYFLTNQNSLALYHDGVFIPELTPLHIDEWLQDSSRIEWRFIRATDSDKMSLGALSGFLSEVLRRTVTADPLEVSRGLVSLVLQLPGWTKRTVGLSERARTVRQILLKASDPHQVLFVDLAAAMGALPDFSSGLIQSILELSGAFSRLLAEVEGRLFQALCHSSDLKSLNTRARVVAGISGDFRLDAFATRLATYSSRERDLEPLMSLAVNKPSREWTDRDIEAVILQLGEWSLAFRRVEALAPLRNRPATRHAFAVVFGPADGSTTFSRTIEISSTDRKKVSQIAQNLLASHERNNGGKEVFLAALAEAGASLVSELGEEI